MTTFRKFPACSCLAKWLPAYEAELKRRGILTRSGALRIYQLIGGAKASGGTHSTGGCFDLLDLPGGEDIWVARQMGADATWSRPYNWDNRKGMAHVHGVLTGCPHNGPARYQIDDVRDGLNGLANHARDTGPRPLSGRTWQQGIEWAKKQAAPPVVMSHTDLVIYQQNVAGDKGNLTPRAAVIADRARAAGARMLVAQELPAKFRPIVSRALAAVAKMSMVSNHKNLVQYVVDNRTGWARVGAAKKWSLGNGKYALAVRYRHRTTGADFVLVTIHLSYEHSAWRKRKSEATTLGANLRKTWPGLPWAVVGDANDAHKDTRTRPDDTTGDALESYGLHDLYYDVPAAHKKRERYNTANQGLDPAPQSGIHIDRFFGTASLKGLQWECDVVDQMVGNKAFDHWGVHMKIRITHPVK